MFLSVCVLAAFTEIPSVSAKEVCATFHYFNFSKPIILATTRAPKPEIIDPCNPTPCGINAQCSARNGAASCNCYSGMEGDPYIACKHECTVNTECSSNLACINNKCRDPCPGVCGAHAYCRVTNHFPICKCDAGYIGDPFTSCQIKPTRKTSNLCVSNVIQIALSF